MVVYNTVYNNNLKPVFEFQSCTTKKCKEFGFDNLKTDLQCCYQIILVP